MKKIIRTADEKRGILQVTTVDERWYPKPSIHAETGLPEYQFVPSVTWICGYYPKGVAFYKWLANNGWDESQAIKNAAGDKGSKVHFAIADLIDQKRVAMDAQYLNPSTERLEELTLEEYECLMSFAAWHKETNPQVIIREMTVWSDKYGYAGTIDCIAKIGDNYFVIDFKTGQYLWPEHELQVSAYETALPENDDIMELLKKAGWKGELIKRAILQIGYRKNKAGWKFTEIEDKFDLFLAAQKIWKHETSGEKVLQKDYPLSLSLAPATKEAEAETEKPKKNGKVRS